MAADTALTAHLVQDEKGDGISLIRQAADEMRKRFNIGHSTIQIETAESADGCEQRPASVV